MFKKFDSDLHTLYKKDKCNKSRSTKKLINKLKLTLLQFNKAVFIYKNI